MFTSKIFWITFFVAGLATAAGLWDGGNVITTVVTSAGGGIVIGAFVWFMWGKISAGLDKQRARRG